MIINECAHLVNIATLKATHNDPINHAFDAWVEANENLFIINMNTQTHNIPGTGITTIATIIYREATMKELGIE